MLQICHKLLTNFGRPEPEAGRRTGRRRGESVRRLAAACTLGCLILTGCGPIGFNVGSGVPDADSAEIVVPLKPATREQAAEDAEAAGLNESQSLMGLSYRVSGSWSETEEDMTEEGQMMYRVYTPEGGGSALDVMAKGISLIERDALAEGKRNLGSVGQFMKQWESTYGLTLTQELDADQLPDGADMAWVFESLGAGRGGQGIILIADMYMYSVYYAAEDSQDNPFRDIWNALIGCIEADPPHEDS